MFTSPGGVRSIAIFVSVGLCLCVGLSVRSHMAESTSILREIFCTSDSWPWLGPPLTPMQYVMYFMYFRFCE